jgi:subtilase family serine protease
LSTAVNTARNTDGVNVVSMSWGGSEFSGEQFYDQYFTTPWGHAGVTFVASSGDTGAPTQSPSSSPNVVSVGGTTLTLGAGGTWSSETGWSGSGGGISAYESQPSYQQGVVTQTTTFRADPDVSYNSNPSTGFGVYDSYNNGSTNPWGQWGGTSAAAPQWAALIAIADQGRALAGEGSLDGRSQTLPMLYSMSANNFHDITSGTSTGSTHYSAGPGYDLVTGRGTPFANLVVNDLVGVPLAVAPTLTTISTLGIAAPLVPFSISYATLLGASNGQDSNNAALQFYINGVQNGTLTITHNGVTTAVVAGTTLLGTGDSLTWTGAAGITGSPLNAFTVTAFDGSLSSSTPVQVKINVQALPTLSAISTFGIASPQAPFSISYATLLGASNAQDSNNAAIQFRINSLQNGTLTITHNGVTTAVVAGTTLLGTGDSLTWMGPAGLTGTAVNAFTVTAFDGTLSSSTAVQVTIDVQAAPTQQRYIETFDSTTALQSYTVLGGRTPNFQISSVAAQNGPYGLSASSSNDWIYRNPSPALVQAGDTISVWLQFTRSTNGGAYFGFGASSAGTLALVAAPNTNQLLLQQVNFLSNTSQGGSFANLAAAPQSYTKNTWYRLEVEWSTSGSIIGNLYASDGTTLLNSVKYSGSTGITSGGIAFRATGNSPKYFDSVSDTTGVNSFATQSAVVGRSASVAVDRTDAPPVANAAILIDGNVVATSSVDLTVDPSLNDWQLRRNSLGSKRSG